MERIWKEVKITVAQPEYYAGDFPDEKIAEFLKECMQSSEKGELMILPEYSNAGGLSDAESILSAVKRTPELLAFAAKISKEKSCYLAINVLENRSERLLNSTYLFDTEGKVSFIYDKIHLPLAEVKLGVSYGNGICCHELDGVRFAFMTCYDTYYNEQIEVIAKFKPDIIIISGYQRGERTDIIRAQAKLTAFRCNAYVARSSYSMNSEERGGCSMIVSPDGNILKDMGANVGRISAEVDEKWKYLRPAGFGEGLVRNDDFISMGTRPDVFK